MLSAQRNFKAGYIVTLNGDTTHGSIDYKEWVNPTRIAFRPGTDVTAKNYSVNEISYFEITGKEAYSRGIVEISLDPISINNVKERSNASKIDTVFLKIIYAGQTVTLYSYTDVIKQRFYVREQGNLQPQELIIKRYQGDGSSLITEDLYRTQLRAVALKHNLSSDILQRRIEGARYERNDLRKVVLLMNNQGVEAHTSEEKTSRLNWFFGAGIQQDNARFKGGHRFAQPTATTTLYWLPKVSAGFDFFANPNVGRLFFRLELGYQLNKSEWEFTGNGDKGVYKIDGSTISISPQLNYNLYNSDKIKIPLGVSFYYGFNNYSKNHYQEFSLTSQERIFNDEAYLHLKKGILSFMGKASIIFNNRLEAAFLYRPPTSLTNDGSFGMSTSNMQFQFYYLFRQN